MVRRGIDVVPLEVANCDLKLFWRHVTSCALLEITDCDFKRELLAQSHMPTSINLIPMERIERMILFIRGEKVMLDSDLAELSGVETKALNRAVKRNQSRFPPDFMIQLTATEIESLRYQFGTSNKGRGGRRYLPYAFTEHGALMLANVLNSERAAQMSVQIVRAFVRLRQLLTSNTDLARKLEALEKKYDRQFKVVFDAVRQLMSPPKNNRRETGFHVKPRDGSEPKARRR